MKLLRNAAAVFAGLASPEYAPLAPPMSRFKFAAAAAAAILAAAALFGCYPKTVGPADAGGRRLTWAEMSVEQKKGLMRTAVLPKAAEIFRTWRPERYSEVNCSLCHGQNAEKGVFAMPTEHLPRLSGDFLLRPEFAQHPRTTRLKLDRLVPEIAGALGLKTFSIVTRKGFGCYSCHLGPNGPAFGN